MLKKWQHSFLFMKSVTPRNNGPNKYKLCRCINQCIINNSLHFQRDGVHIAPTGSSLVSPTSSVLCLAPFRASKQSGSMKVNADMHHWWEGAQYQYVSEFNRRRMVGLQEAVVIPWHFDLYRTCCYDSGACMKPVDRIVFSFFFFFFFSETRRNCII